jgi:hypothetical protein
MTARQRLGQSCDCRQRRPVPKPATPRKRIGIEHQVEILADVLGQ